MTSMTHMAGIILDVKAAWKNWFRIGINICARHVKNHPSTQQQGNKYNPVNLIYTKFMNSIKKNTYYLQVQDSIKGVRWNGINNIYIVWQRSTKATQHNSIPVIATWESQRHTISYEKPLSSQTYFWNKVDRLQLERRFIKLHSHKDVCPKWHSTKSFSLQTNQTGKTTKPNIQLN